jgi:hypothetical protein
VPLQRCLISEQGPVCHVLVRVNEPVEYLDAGVVIVVGGVIHDEDADDWTVCVDSGIVAHVRCVRHLHSLLHGKQIKHAHWISATPTTRRLKPAGVLNIKRQKQMSDEPVTLRRIQLEMGGRTSGNP